VLWDAGTTQSCKKNNHHSDETQAKV
jgi:hypothetical protein